MTHKTSAPSSTTLAHAHQLYAAGNILAAINTLNTEIEGKKTPSRDALRMRAQIWLATNDIQQAAKDMDLLLHYYPDDAETCDDRGVLFQQQGDFMQAALHHLRAVDVNPTHDGYLLNLAVALDNLGQRHNAEQLYRDIIMLNPNNARALTNLAVILDSRDDYEQAEAYLQQSAATGHDSFEFNMAYGNLNRKQGKRDEAIAWYRKALHKRPDNAQAQFLLDAMTGEVPEAPPAEHISSLFDGYADTFDKSLVDRLKYRAPELLFEQIKDRLQENHQNNTDMRAIDLGAGTGLFGKLIRPYFKTSIGLDLSEKMLIKAQEQNIYDDVICNDMLHGLNQFPDNHFDLISACDVFVYQGKLDDILSEAHRTLTPNGLCVFSTEALTSDANSNAHDFLLNDTGRYTHSETYLKRIAHDSGFKIITLMHNWLRYNKDKPLYGFIVVLEKTV